MVMRNICWQACAMLAAWPVDIASHLNVTLPHIGNPDMRQIDCEVKALQSLSVFGARLQQDI
eukprot:8116166-Pyramimonas_sp.AAC.1